MDLVLGDEDWAAFPLYLHFVVSRHFFFSRLYYSCAGCGRASSVDGGCSGQAWGISEVRVEGEEVAVVEMEVAMNSLILFTKLRKL